MVIFMVFRVADKLKVERISPFYELFRVTNLQKDIEEFIIQPQA